MQDDCLDVSNKPFYKRRKKLIPLPRGASFRTSQITLMLTWRLYYGGAVITSIAVPPLLTFVIIMRSSSHQATRPCKERKTYAPINLLPHPPNPREGSG